MGRLHSKRDCELAPAKAAGIIRQKRYEQIAVFDLKSAYNVVGVGMPFVIYHHYLKRCVIILIEYVGKQLTEPSGIGMRAYYYRDRRELSVIITAFDRT